MSLHSFLIMDHGAGRTISFITSATKQWIVRAATVHVGLPKTRGTRSPPRVQPGWAVALMATASTARSSRLVPAWRRRGRGPGQRASSLLVRSGAWDDAARPRVRRDTGRPIRGAEIIGGRGPRSQRARRVSTALPPSSGAKRD